MRDKLLSLYYKMKSFSIFFAVFFISTTVLMAQLGQPKGKIHELPEESVAKTISLNPEYWVHGEELAEGDQKQPLLIVLHGGGGTGLDIQRVKGASVRHLRTLQLAGIKSIVVAPQASKSPIKEGSKGGWVPADLNILLAHLLVSLPVDPDRVYLTGSQS